VKDSGIRLRSWLAGISLAVAAATALAQQQTSLPAANPASVQSSPAAPGAPAAGKPTAPAKPVRPKDRRRAAKLYLAGSKLYAEGHFEPAMHDYETAAALDPSKPEYEASVQLARSHEVTALIQDAAKERNEAKFGAARADIAHAGELDPKNPEVAQHLRDLADIAVATEAKPIYEASAETAEDAPALAFSAGKQSFHLKLDRRQLIQRVYKAYGIDATIDQSVPALPARFDIDDVDFHRAEDVLNIATNTFAVPLDAHRVLVARDTRENRQQFERQEYETIYLPGFSQSEMTEVSHIARDIFAIQASIEQNLGAISFRAPTSTLNAFNATMRDLVNGRSQVLLDVRIFQLAHSVQRNTGAQLPQQVTAFNVYAEEQSILNANQSLVQQIISSGLASPNDPLAILGILIASGQVSSSLFSNGIALFGGGLTLSGLSPQPVTLNLNLNSSDTRELDDVQLRLADDQDETIRTGTRYPILQASYSGLATNAVNIPGLTTAGSSSGLSSLLSGISGATTQIPQVQYQDIGLSLKTNPKVMRDGDVALTMDLKITALTGSSLNGIPVLNNRSYSGVITLKNGEAAVMMSELDKQESLALSGIPGLTQVPGLNNVTSKDLQSNYATLLVVLTPHLIRAPHAPAQLEPLRIERSTIVP
jgi:general secretion pathway protein D